MEDLIIRLQNKVDLQDRTTAKYRQDGRCNKSVFVDRISRRLYNRSFKLVIKDKVYYALFLLANIKSTRCSNSVTHTWQNGGLSFYLGYSNNEYELSFINHHIERENIILHYNDLFRIQVKEIPFTEFISIYKLFK